MKSHENDNLRGCYKALALVTTSFISIINLLIIFIINLLIIFIISIAFLHTMIYNLGNHRTAKQ